MAWAWRSAPCPARWVHRQSFPLDGFCQHAREIQHFHGQFIADKRILHRTKHMDLALRAGRDQDVTAGGMRLPQALYLHGLAEGVASGPGAIATAYGACPPILHFREGDGIEALDQFSRQVGAIFQTAQTTRPGPCAPAGPGVGPPRIIPIESFLPARS